MSDIDSFDIDGPVEKKINRDDFSSMFVDLFKRVNFKIAILLFMLGILIFSDIFVEYFLILFNGSVDGMEATTKGTMIQLTMLSLGYIIIDLLVQGDIL